MTMINFLQGFVAVLLLVVMSFLIKGLSVWIDEANKKQIKKQRLNYVKNLIDNTITAFPNPNDSAGMTFFVLTDDGDWHVEIMKEGKGFTHHERRLEKSDILSQQIIADVLSS